MLVRNKLPWDSHLADWRFQRICRLFCIFGIHLARIGNLYGKPGLTHCAHCGTVLVG